MKIKRNECGLNDDFMNVLQKALFMPQTSIETEDPKKIFGFYGAKAETVIRLACERASQLAEEKNDIWISDFDEYDEEEIKIMKEFKALVNIDDLEDLNKINNFYLVWRELERVYPKNKVRVVGCAIERTMPLKNLAED